MPCRATNLDSSHEEADSRVFFHASKVSSAIIYSPDTDVFMIGLPLLDRGLRTNIIIRLDTPQQPQQLYLHLNKLHDCLVRDPDMASIPAADRAKALQVMYISTGCDFVSAFAGKREGIYCICCVVSRRNLRVVISLKLYC